MHSILLFSFRTSTQIKEQKDTTRRPIKKILLYCKSIVVKMSYVFVKKQTLKREKKTIKDTKKAFKRNDKKQTKKNNLKGKAKKGEGERGGGAHRMSIGETRLQITQNIRGLHTTNQLGFSILCINPSIGLLTLARE